MGKIILYIFGGLLLIGLIGRACAPSGDNNPTTPKASEKVVNSSWDGSVRQVERYLKNNLKDPDSYQAIAWGPVVDGQTPKGRYHVQHKYRAKNSFGGYVIEFHVFHLDSDGNIIGID